jgi:hypothetical protein
MWQLPRVHPDRHVTLALARERGNRCAVSLEVNVRVLEQDDAPARFVFPIEPRRVSRPVTPCGVAPTLANLLGVKPPSSAIGNPLAEVTGH